MTKKLAADVAALLRARNPLLWVITREEARVERYLVEAAAAAGYTSRTWDCGQGVATVSGKVESNIGSKDPGETLEVIRDRSQRNSERCVWIMRDLTVWLSGPVGITTQRILRNLARTLPGTPRDRAQAIIVLTPSTEIPPELSNHATVIEWPLPDREEMASILDANLDVLPEDIKASAVAELNREEVIDAAIGLSGEEASSCFARSLVQTRKVDSAIVAAEKKRVVTRERVLEWFDPLPGGMDAVGGLSNLKVWLEARKNAYSPEARKYGLPTPRGVLIAGIPGTGKSLSAKAIATSWAVPLLRLDMNALKSKFVGDSESNLRRAIKVIEAIGRCVVWIDEIEKAMQGATSGSADGGVSADALGTILSWMQERKGEAFVIATANDVEGLPPELLRKGRFDEVWWVDLPTPEERVEILNAALRSHGRDKVEIDARQVSAACESFTGSEIAAIVPDALFAAFNDGAREITTEDLLDASHTVVPLARTASEKIERLRKWSEGRARPAAGAPIQRKALAVAGGRDLDL